MYILDLDSREKKLKFDESFYNTSHSYLILSETSELKHIKDILNIDDTTFNECLNFDENIKMDLFDNYDFLSINTFEINSYKIYIKECNIYISDNFILVVCDKNYFLYDNVKEIITNHRKIDNISSTAILFKINYMIFKSIIINQFENLEKLEDVILELEDDMMDGIKDNHIEKINHVRGMSRCIVKNIRPLLYIGDRIVKENIRFLKHKDIKKYNLESLQGIDFSIDKLYKFALSTRELADKLLDIYSSKVAENTNNLINKLTLLTAISAPLAIITGIYGMNFRVMPILNLEYGYYITLGIMSLIVIVGIAVFKMKKFL